MPRRRYLAAAAVLAVLALSGCAGKSSVSTSVGDALGRQGGNGAVIDLSSHHYQVGDVSGTTLTGGHLSLAGLRGKLVVVNFWGSWCGPCRAEAPAFAQVARDDAKRGVAFVGIDVRESSPASGLAFDRKFHVGYPSIYDRDQALALQFPHAIPASTPTTIVVGRTGQILAKVTGGLDYTHLRSLVHAALTEQA